MSQLRGKFVVDSPSGLDHIRNPFLPESRRLSGLGRQRIVYYLERSDGLIKIGTTCDYTRRR